MNKLPVKLKCVFFQQYLVLLTVLHVSAYGQATIRHRYKIYEKIKKRITIRHNTLCIIYDCLFSHQFSSLCVMMSFRYAGTCSTLDIKIYLSKNAINIDDPFVHLFTNRVSINVFQFSASYSIITRG